MTWGWFWAGAAVLGLVMNLALVARIWVEVARRSLWDRGYREGWETRKEFDRVRGPDPDRSRIDWDGHKDRGDGGGGYFRWN